MKHFYQTFEGIQKQVSRLVYGTGIPLITGDDKEMAFACLDRAWQCGFRTYDTAHTYGNAEKFLGEWMLRRGNRDQIVLIDKGCNPGQIGYEETFSAATIRSQVKESQYRLQTDHFEFYLLHRDDETKPVDEIVEVLNELKAQGVMTYFGVSNWRQKRIQEANQYALEHGLIGFTAISPSFSLADLSNDLWGGSITLSGEENLGFRSWLEKNQMPVFNYSSLARGYLSGRYDPNGGKAIEECLHEIPIREYDSPQNRERLRRAFSLAKEKNCTPTQICLAWVLGQKMNLFPIVSPSSLKHMEENVKAFEIPMSDHELCWLETGEEE